MPARYLILSYGPDQEKLKKALGTALLLARESATNLTIVVPTIRNASSTILRHVLDEKTMHQLTNGKSIKTNGTLVSMRSIKTLNEYENNGAIVALWGGEKMIEKMEKCTQAAAFVVLTWTENDAEKWKVQHKPIVLQ